MGIRLTPTQSRWLAVSLLIISICASFFAIALPTWLINQRYDSFIEDYSSRLTRHRRISGLRPDIESATADVTAHNGKKYYLKGATPNLAGAELHSLVTRIIEAHRGRISSSQVLTSADDSKDKDAPAIKVSINTQMFAAIVPLQLILHAIETNEPYLFIDKLSIQSTLGRAYRPEPGIQPEFLVQLTISGYLPKGVDKQ